MGEVGLIDGDVVVLEEIGKEEEELKKETNVVTWESLVPRMFLRILLVEGDDSTRQIITALLQKCNYKVSAVSDGSKAWEMLKDKPHNIDLILTEVQLPSISGLCLLNLIMGHEIFKNIPVIMMSSHDSIGIVFKCMMRGAADFLVKPIRRNELRNLWQHVWRRQTSSDLRHGCQDGNLVQGKMGATSENNAASNHSSDYVACGQKNKDYSEKGSDAQSSCTKPDMEAESACLNNMQDFLQPKCSSSLAIDIEAHKHEERVKLGGMLMHENEAEDKSMRLVSEVTPNHQVFNSTVIIIEENHAHPTLMTGDKVMASASYGEKSDTVNDDGFERQVRVEPSREVIDLIGTIENQLHCSYWRSDDNIVRGNFSDDTKYLPGKIENMCKLSSSLPLDLSLRRFEPSGNQEIAERHTLNHSNASAFSRYTNRTLQHAPSSASFTEPKQCTNETLKPPNQDPDNAVDALQHSREEQNNIEEDNPRDKMVFSCPQLGILPVTIPYHGMPLDGLHARYGTLLQTMFYTHAAAPPGPPPWSTDSTSLQETLHVKKSFHHSTCNPEKDHHYCDQIAVKSSDQLRTIQEQNSEYMEDTIHISSATDQSVNSSLCNNSKGHMKSSGCRSICDGSTTNVTATAVDATTFESGNDEGIITSDPVKVMGERVSQREAALTKFRLKRKDRCYEKKVRYQSRKRLAEQRPRVKGQFVRRVQADSQLW
ncbi:hypothetical protein AAC387_Pa01g3434 [Persea americana]